MKKIFRAIPVALILCLTFAAPSCKSGNSRKGKAQVDTLAKPAEKPVITYRANDTLNDPARIMAGLPVDSTSSLAHWMNNEAWKAYKADMDRTWALCTETLDKVRGFSSGDLSDIDRQTKTAFYPFSGPDFAFIDAYYPSATTYWLLAGEICGKPTTGDNVNEKAFGVYKGALRTLLETSYFITSYMMKDLNNQSLQGALPVIEFFLARTGCDIVSIKKISLKEDGSLVDDPEGRGAEIKFFKRDKNTVLKTLYYLNCNLCNDGYTPGLTPLFAKLDTTTTSTFVKSASYLMHWNTFSNIRDQVLKTAAVIQDDTGAPYRYYKPDTWDVSLYGGYQHPIRDFSEACYQKDLAAAYQSPDVKPLGFRLGYNKTSSMIVARKKSIFPKAAPQAAADSAAQAK